jgi:hypothetical protein
MRNADVGDPRDYKWINTVPLPKSELDCWPKLRGNFSRCIVWEQMNVARSFKTNNIWILNVGDLKLLEVPLEYFMDLAYDSDRWPRDSLLEYLSERLRGSCSRTRYVGGNDIGLTTRRTPRVARPSWSTRRASP